MKQSLLRLHECHQLIRSQKPLLFPPITDLLSPYRPSAAAVGTSLRHRYRPFKLMSPPPTKCPRATCSASSSSCTRCNSVFTVDSVTPPPGGAALTAACPTRIVAVADLDNNDEPHDLPLALWARRKLRQILNAGENIVRTCTMTRISYCRYWRSRGSQFRGSANPKTVP